MMILNVCDSTTHVYGLFSKQFLNSARNNEIELMPFLILSFIIFHRNYRIADPSQRENLGIIVQYKVKVKLCIGGPILGG